MTKRRRRRQLRKSSSARGEASRSLSFFLPLIPLSPPLLPSPLPLSSSSPFLLPSVQEDPSSGVHFITPASVLSLHPRPGLPHQLPGRHVPEQNHRSPQVRPKCHPGPEEWDSIGGASSCPGGPILAIWFPLEFGAV